MKANTALTLINNGLLYIQSPLYSYNYIITLFPAYEK